MSITSDILLARDEKTCLCVCVRSLATKQPESIEMKFETQVFEIKPKVNHQGKTILLTKQPKTLRLG